MTDREQALETARELLDSYTVATRSFADGNELSPIGYDQVKAAFGDALLEAEARGWIVLLSTSSQMGL